MKRETLIELLVLVALVAAGAGARIVFHDIPNFAPIAAMALFAGYFFRRWSWAVCVPLLAMGISDLALEGYQWQMMLVVYTMLALPVAARSIVRWAMRFERGQLVSSTLALLGLVGCSLAASVLFFLTTNFAWWPWTSMYTHDMPGLVECYAAGLPFFRYTLAGDLFYACILFGGYALAVQWGWAKQATGAVAPAPGDLATAN